MLMKRLYDMQQNLDYFIRQNKGITKKEIELLNDVCLAVMVEIGEFTAEFEKEKDLYEYVDILHFLLRVNNILELNYRVNNGFEEIYKACSFPLETSREKETLDLYQSFSKFVNETRCFKYWSKKKSEEKDTLVTSFGMVMLNFMSLGNFMNYKAEEIIEAYKNKRNENFTRQESGY